MDQSELGANTCNRCQARENACERGTIGFGLGSITSRCSGNEPTLRKAGHEGAAEIEPSFGFASHWLRNWREFC